MTKKRYKMTWEVRSPSLGQYFTRTRTVTLEELVEPVSPLPEADAQPTKEDPVEKVFSWFMLNTALFGEQPSARDLAQQLLNAGLDPERLK